MLEKNVIQKFLEGFEEGDENECWEWEEHTHKDGYGVFGLNYKIYYAHRVSWKYYNEKEISEDMCVCHTCDNPSCVNPNHLWLGSHKDNMQDMVRKGRANPGGEKGTRGEKHGRAKLTEQDVRKIRRLYSDKTKNYTYQSLGKMFGVAGSRIGAIVRFKTWGHVKQNQGRKIHLKNRGK